MKKYLITFTFAFLTCLSAISQNTIVYNPENKANFGFRIGGEIAKPYDIQHRLLFMIFNVLSIYMAAIFT